jgi:hypothetical protein
MLSLHDLKAVGHHLRDSAREKGESTAMPVAFMGLVTMAIGAMMVMQASKQMERGR